MKSIDFKKLVAAKALAALKMAAATSLPRQPVPVPVRAKITPRFGAAYPK